MRTRKLIPRGDRRIILRAPDLRPRADPTGARIAEGPRELRRWARYWTVRGSEGVDATGQVSGRVLARWEVRRAGLAAVTTRWTLHHDGQAHGILAVLPSTLGRGRSHVEILTGARD